MLSTRLRGISSLLVKTPIRIALGLLAAYFLFAWFGFEPLVKWAAPKFIADQSRHHLSLEGAKFDPLRLSVDLKGLKLTEPDGKPLLAFAELFVDFDAAGLLQWTYTFDRIRLTAPQARVELRPDGSLNWMALIEALQSKEKEEEKPLPRLLVRRIELVRGQVDFADRKMGFETRLDPLDFTLTDLSTLPADKGAHTLAATTPLGARLRWKGDFSLQPLAATGELGIDQVTLARLWPYVGGKLNMAPPSGRAHLALNYRMGYADRRLSLVLDQIGFHLEGLGLSGKGASREAITLDHLAVKGGRFDLEKRQLDIGEVALSGGQVALQRDRTGRLDVLDWLPPAAEETRAPSPAPAAGSDAWRINLARFSLNGLGLQLRDAGFAQPLQAEIGNLQVGFNARAEVGGTETRAELDQLGVALSGLRLVSGKTPVFVLGGINLDEGHIDLGQRSVRIGRVALANGKVDVVRDAQGHMALLDAFQPAPGKPAVVAPPPRVAAAETAPVWHYRVDQLGLSGFQLGYRDESVQPAGGLTLQQVAATVRGVSEDLNKPLPVQLGFRVKEGGTFQAEGRVLPNQPRADLRLKLVDLALAPVQPWLGQAANLALVSGRVSSQGQVKFDGKAVGEKQVSFQGGFAVDDLLLNESETGDRFLAWKHLGSDSLRATPAGLDMDELRLDGLGAKLIIYQDKTVNLKKILKTPPPTEQQAAAAEAQPPAPVANPSPPFRLNIDRIRLARGEVDFADLSLQLPFGTRVHDFKGAFNGISSQPGAVAELELDGRVDEFGLARVVGQLNLFDPTGFMDIKTVFRNVEMNRLTPYTATFAGYKVASGKLSLDLEYKIQQRQLQGENQIILDKLTLGERLEGPDIKHLPLELAIAILQDSDGRIDLGLPVSGSLDDPQFSYGRIIWKAIGNILGKIVTAPFRALAGLFGGNGEKLEKIAFEAGEAGLTPPEKEKFGQIAHILNKRPGLALTVHGVWSAEADRPVMKERQLRRAVAEKMGMKLAADEDAGPISTANPKSRLALENLYAARFGEAEWKSLEGRWFQANPEKKQQGGAGKMLSRLKVLFKPEAPLTPEDLTALQGADLHALLYARLLDKETVGDAALHQLAEQRARAVITGLAAAGAPRERLQVAASQAHAGEGREVPAKLELGVAARP